MCKRNDIQLRQNDHRKTISNWYRIWYTHQQILWTSGVFSGCTGLHSQYTLSSVGFRCLHRHVQPTAAKNEVCWCKEIRKKTCSTGFMVFLKTMLSSSNLAQVRVSEKIITVFEALNLKLHTLLAGQGVFRLLNFMLEFSNFPRYSWHFACHCADAHKAGTF